MDFFRKSAIRKMFFILLLFCLPLAGVYYYFYSSGQTTVPYYVFIGALFALLLLFTVVFWTNISRPLKTVLYQVQALLAGKQYKRIYTNRIDEIGILAHFFNQVTSGLGKVSGDLKDRERMIDELTIASQLQRDILPLNNSNVPGLMIVAKTKPATEVGGDSFNLFTVKGKTYVYVGDVTGHGVAAGLMMTMVNSLVSVFSDLYGTAYGIIVNVNKYIKRHVKKSMFMTMVMLSWDHTAKKMTYVGAGHEHILVYKADSGQCEAILSGGIALGMIPDNSKVIKELDIPLNNGDFVVLYTDGITEARNAAGEQYGLERLKSAIKEYATQYSAEGVNFHIAKDLSAYMKDTVQSDDITLIVMQRDDKVTMSTPEVGQSTSW